jgi:hypothetical protein
MLLGAAAFAATVALPSEAVSPPPDPPLISASLPAEKSPRPAFADWKTSTPVRLQHVSPKAARCKVYLVKEWVRVRCLGGVTSAITQLGGEREGVAFWIDSPPDPATGVPGDGEAVFPVRRGDRRLLQFWTLGPGYDGPLTVVPAFTLQEEWIDPDAGPTLLLL